MPYIFVRVKLVKQVRTCRKYLYANVGSAVETNLHLNSRPSDLDSPPAVMITPPSSSDLHKHPFTE